MEVHFEKIQGDTTRLSEQVMQVLMEAIQSGKIRVGEDLPPERELAEELGVSRAPLRECLAILDFLGVIENRGNRKAVVKGSDYFQKALLLLQHTEKQDLQMDVLETRRFHESAAARLACERATEEDLKSMREILDRLKADPLDHMADAAFHSALAKASHNAVLAMSMDMLNSLIWEFRIRYYTLPNYQERTLESHCRMYRAVAERDADRAEQEVQKHMDMAFGFFTEAPSES